MAATIADHIASQNLVAGILAALVAREPHRSWPARRRVVARQPDLGAGERVHLLLADRVSARAGEQGQRDDPGDLRDLPHVRRVDRDRRRGRSAASPRFYELLGRPELTTDPRFASPLLDEAAEGRALPDPVRGVPGSRHCRVVRSAPVRGDPIRARARSRRGRRRSAGLGERLPRASSRTRAEPR